MDGLAVQALIRLLVKGGGAIPVAADEPVGAQRTVEAVHILLVPLRTVLAEILYLLPKIPILALNRPVRTLPPLPVSPTGEDLDPDVTGSDTVRLRACEVKSGSLLVSKDPDLTSQLITNIVEIYALV